MMRLLRSCLVLALLAASSVTQSAEFDDQRVFTWEHEREQMDRARARMDTSEPGAAQAPSVESPPKVPEIRLQGFIRRSDGPPAVWLNDRNTLSGDRVEGGLMVESGRIEGQKVFIRLPDGRQVRLKPGQRYDPEGGKVVDVLDD